MRIGILTLPLHTNYGGILQAYALQTTLERLGHEVLVFQNDYDGLWHIPSWKMPLFWMKRLMRKCFMDKNTPIFIEQKVKREQSVICQNTEKFIRNYVHSFHVNNLSAIPLNQFDGIVVGSDQIWRADYVRRTWQTDIQNAFLKFVGPNGIKRVAYAASFGKDEWCYSKEETAECAQLAHLFDGIAVREESGIELCSKYLGIKVVQVLDPTMLLSEQDYINLFVRAKDIVPRSNGNLFYYMLDATPEKSDFINRIARENGMRPYTFAIHDDDTQQPVEQRIVPPVESWLRGFYEAKLVVTDSFHGCVFSIIFGKPFIALGNAKRGMSRFTSLLKLFSLENHLIFDLNDNISIKDFELPDYLNNRLSELQEESLGFLNQTLL